jgi:hypothetical protein
MHKHTPPTPRLYQAHLLLTHMQLLPIILSSLIKSYPPVSSKVSQSCAGQVVSVFKLSPDHQREREGQLIHRQGLQNRKFTHQLCIRSALDGHLKGVLASFRLTDQGHGTRIKADGHTVVGKALAQVVVIGSSRERPHSSQCCGTISLVPDSCTPSPGPVTLLPIQDGMIVPSAWLADRPLKVLGGRAHDWADGG